MSYSILTFGCRVNQADSLRIEEQLRARGEREAPSAVADLVVVNTCSVTASADQGARQAIRRIARENPGARIVATGCYATRCEGELAALPSVVRVVRNDDKLEAFRAGWHRLLAAPTDTAIELRERSGDSVRATGGPAAWGQGRPSDEGEEGLYPD